MKIWFLNNAIKLCNFWLKDSAGEEEREEINEVVEMKNYFIKELRKCTNDTTKK
jgi:hypothetical protein